MERVSPPFQWSPLRSLGVSLTVRAALPPCLMSTRRTLPSQHPWGWSPVHSDTTTSGVCVGPLAETPPLRPPFYGTCPLTDAKPNAEIREQWGSSQQGSPAPLSWPRGLGGCLRHSPLMALSVESFILDPFVGNRLSASISLSLSFVAPCPLKLGFWTGLFVCSSRVGLCPAGCM